MKSHPRHVLLPALLLATAPELAAAQRIGPPDLDPAEYASPSGSYVLRVDPTTRSGAGPADCRLARDGETVWAEPLPFTFRGAVDLGSGRFMGLTDSTMRTITLTRDGHWGVGRDARAYVSDWKETRADYYRVDLSTGERTPIVEAQQLGKALVLYGQQPTVLQRTYRGSQRLRAGLRDGHLRPGF